MHSQQFACGIHEYIRQGLSVHRGSLLVSRREEVCTALLCLKRARTQQHLSPLIGSSCGNRQRTIRPTSKNLVFDRAWSGVSAV